MGDFIQMAKLAECKMNSEPFSKLPMRRLTFIEQRVEYSNFSKLLTCSHEMSLILS